MLLRLGKRSLKVSPDRLIIHTCVLQVVPTFTHRHVKNLWFLPGHVVNKISKVGWLPSDYALGIASASPLAGARYDK